FFQTLGTISIVSQLDAGAGTIHLTGGTFQLTGSEQIGQPSNSTKLSVDGGTFDLQSNNETVAGVMLVSGSITGTGTLTSTTTFQTQSGSISAILAGSVGLTQNSANSTTTLSGANTYTGNTTITNGTVKLAANNVIPDGS